MSPGVLHEKKIEDEASAPADGSLSGQSHPNPGLKPAAEITAEEPVEGGRQRKWGRGLPPGWP